MGMILMSNTETNVSANFRDEQTAYFAAKAGIEEIRDRLRAGANGQLALPTTLGTRWRRAQRDPLRHQRPGQRNVAGRSKLSVAPARQPVAYLFNARLGREVSGLFIAEIRADIGFGVRH